MSEQDIEQKTRECALTTLCDSLYEPILVGVCSDCEHASCKEKRTSRAIWLAARRVMEDCIPVPRAEYDREKTELRQLRRALWELMIWCNFPNEVQGDCEPLELIGFIDPHFRTWLIPAHAFAAEMKERERQER